MRGWPAVELVTADGERRPRLVVGANALDHGGCRLVHADDVNRDAMVAKLQDDPVEGVDGRDVPEVRRLQVDHHSFQCFLAKIEGGVEGFSRGEEYVPGIIKIL